MTTPGVANDQDYLPALPDLAARPELVPPMLLDLTGAGATGLDDVDRAVMAAVAEDTDTRALWRAWRFRADEDPVRLFLVEMNAGKASSALPTPADGSLVETYPVTTGPPGHLRTARGRSALLWSAEPAAPIHVARVFDRVDPAQGPQFDPDHPTVTGADRPQQLLGYLNAGQLLLATTDRMPDILDAGAGPVVPMSYRTDGSWVWTDTVAYYLRTYGLSPDPELVAHIRARDHVVSPVSAAAAHRALAALMS